MEENNLITWHPQGSHLRGEYLPHVHFVILTMKEDKDYILQVPGIFTPITELNIRVTKQEIAKLKAEQIVKNYITTL